MTFVQFDLERWQSTWENIVEFNLSESGVHPLSVAELLDLTGTEPETLLNTRIGYSQSNGSPELRDEIYSMYPGATRENVIVTVGSSEANFLVCWTLLNSKSEVAILTPTYAQTWGLSHSFGARVTEVPLTIESGWQPAPDEIKEAIKPGTDLIVVTDPNNPTGRIFPVSVRNAVLERARELNCWLLVDEVYRGAERNHSTTASWWGSYERLITVGGFSKAYGLPGLRIGWIVAPEAFTYEAWRRHDYTVICPTPVSDLLGTLALQHREQLYQRTRNILNTNYPVLDAWLKGFGSLFEWIEPECGAICFVRYELDVPSTDLVEAIRLEQDVLMVPGDHFQRPRFLRFGYGNEQEELEAALERVRRGLRNWIGD